MQNSNNRQEIPQNFELTTLLFKERQSTKRLMGSNVTSGFESFQARFQSFIDQIPSYLHSSNKPGFFTHFFLGNFATLLDTELNQKLDVKNLYFRFDGAKTLMIVAETKQKTHVFIFTEDAKAHAKHKFTKAEWKSIKNRDYNPLSDQGNLDIKLIKINKSKTIITTKVTNHHINPATTPLKDEQLFQQITRQRDLGDYLENDIRLLASSDSEQVETALRKVLTYVKKVNASLNLPTNVYGQRAREANQHGFIAGVLDNFRYRHNTRIYLEQFAGRGYADIVLLVRGAERSVRSIPVIIELKADNPQNQEKTPPNDALNQIKEQYIPGFQPNTARVLTLSDHIIAVGLNLDYVPTQAVNDVLTGVNNIIGNDNIGPALDNNTRATLKARIKEELSRFIEINDPHLTKIVDEWQGNKAELKRKIQNFMELPFKSEVMQQETQNIRPVIAEILQSTRTTTDHLELQDQIRNHLERAYSTFPGTKESRNNHYFSRFLLGQSILLPSEQYTKQVFHYKKADIIPTEELPTSTTKQPPRAAKTNSKKQSSKNTEAKIDTSHAVTTVLLSPTKVTDPVILLNIVESDRDTPINKKIELTVNIVGNREIIKLNVQFRTDNKDKAFEEYCSVQSVERYDDLGDYNARNSVEPFQGEFKDIPYPPEFKEAFDTALNSQRNEVLSNTEYGRLFEQVSSAISPFRSLDPNFVSLITEEAHFQGVSHGAFNHYSDLKLAELPATRALVLTEFQTGKGKRIDMLIHGIGIEASSLAFKEFKPVGLELKGPRGEITAAALMREAKKQLKDYKTVTYKTLTDGDRVQLIPVIFDKAADVNHVIRLGDELVPVVVVHSSIHLLERGRESLGRTQSDPKRVKSEYPVTVEGLRQRFKNIVGIAEEDLNFLESATDNRDYNYWLRQHDIADIARIEYGYGTNAADTVFHIGSPESLPAQLQQFRDSVRGGETRPLTLIVNLNNNHWITLVVSHQNGQYHGYYADSLYDSTRNTPEERHEMPNNIRQVLQQAHIPNDNIHDIRISQQTDGHNCGLWALENARDINNALYRLPIDAEIRRRLEVPRDEAHFIERRQYFSAELRVDPDRITNLETIILAEHDNQGGGNVNLRNCLNGSRKKRSADGCLFSKDDVNEFIQENDQHYNIDKAAIDLDKITLDSEKFTDYLKTDILDEKRAQLIELASKVKVSGSVDSRRGWLKSQETQQAVYMKLSNFLADKFPHAKITPIAQSLHLSEFKKGIVKTNDMSTGINWALLKLSTNERALFLQNLKTLKLLHNRLLQGQPISIRDYREYFAFSKVLSDFSKTFEEKLIIQKTIQNNKKLIDLQNTINGLQGDFTIYLEVSGNRAVIQRRDNLYSYLDSSIGYIEGLRELSDEGQEMQKAEVLEVFEKANILSGYLMQPKLTTEYELEEDKFSIELIDQGETDQVFSATEKQKLISPIETERHRLSLQDKQLGKLQFKGREIARTELYDLGMKLLPAGNTKESGELITGNMNLSNEKLKEYLTTRRISINADAYLTALVQHLESERTVLAQTLKTVLFEGLDHTIQRSQEIQKLLTSTEDSQFKKYQLKKLLYQPTELDIQSMSYNDPKFGITEHLPNRLTNAAGRISMLHGGYSTIQALRYGDTTGFALGAGEMSFSLFSQLIENGVVKVTPQIIKQMKYGVHFSRGFAGLITTPFDMYDLIQSSIDASKATKGSKAWRDNIASATFAGASIGSSVVFTAVGMPGVGIVVGFGIIVGQGIYSGASMIVEYKKYHLTTDQEFRLFWHTFGLQPLPEDVQYTQARQEILKELAKNAWEQLKNRPEVVAYAMGLGNIALQEATTRSKRGIFDVFSSIKEKVSDFGNYVKTRVSNLGNSIQQKAKDLGNSIKTQAVKFGNVIEKEISNFSSILEKKIENFGKNVKKKADDFGNYIKSLGDSTQKKISVIGDNIETKAINLMNNIEKKTSNFSNKVEQKASNLGNAIKSKVNELSDNARSEINNFVDEVKSEVNDLGNNIKEKTSNVVDYVREVFEIKNLVPILSPDKSIINLQDVRSENLARILPEMPDQNAVGICLPQFTGKDYEYDHTLGKKSPIYGKSNTASYICDNAMVIADRQKITREDSNATIIYDGALIRSGYVFSHPQYNGKFIINSGTAKFQGTSNKINSFLVTNETFSGGVIGGKGHAVNLLDISLLEYAAVNYTITAKNGKVVVSNNLVLPGASGSFTAENINHFVGRVGKQEIVNCNNNLEIILDTQGGGSQLDKIKLENCKHVIVSANTEVTGYSSQPNFYIKPGIGAYNINVITNQGKLIFPDTVLDQLHNIIYSPKENILSIDINLNQGTTTTQHPSHSTLQVNNYLNTTQQIANFELIDKNSHIIEPMIPSDAESKSVTITAFSLKAEIDFKNTDPVTWYEDISKTWQGYSVYAVVKDKNFANSYRIFGSSQSDVISLGKEVPWAQGRNGSDSYTFTINNTTGIPEDIPVKINNYAQDKLRDILYIPTNNEIAASKQNQDLFLRTNLDDIQAVTYATYIENYFLGDEYQHIIIVDDNKKSWIPFSDKEQDISILPFYRATTQHLIFTITAEQIKESSRIVLDISSEQLKFYRNNNDLYLIAQSSNVSNPPLRIRLEQFYTNETLSHEDWQSFSVYCQQDGRMLTNQILIQFAQLAIDYINLKNNDLDVIQTYVVDLSNTQKIYHNQIFNNGTWSVVSADKERFGVLDFRNQSPSNLKIFASNKDLEFSNGNHTSKLTVVNWDNSQNRISVLKFNNTYITGLERFNISEIQELVNKVVLSQVADQQLEQYGQDVVNGLKYLLSIEGIQHGKSTYRCLGFNSADEQGDFVIAYHNDIKGKQGVEHIVNDLHTVDAFIWLMIKARSELLLKGYNKNSLSNEFEQCFDSIVSKEIINQLAQQLDIDNSTTSISRFINTHHATLLNIIDHHLSEHQQHQSTTNISLSEAQIESSNRSKRAIDIIEETNVNTYYDNVSSGSSSRLQFWPINLIKKSGEAVLSFLSIGKTLPQLELLVKQQLAQMLSNDLGTKLDNNQQRKEELVKSGLIHTEIKKDDVIDTDLNLPKTQSRSKNNQSKSRFEFSKDHQYIVWSDQDNQAYNMASWISGFVFESDNKFQLQKHYVGCGRVPEDVIKKRDASNYSDGKNKHIHIIRTHQGNLLCLDFHSIEKFDNVNQLPSWALTCKQQSLIELAIPVPKLPSYLDITEQNTSLILKGMNIHNMVDNGVKIMLPALSISQRSMIAIPTEILIILGASYVNVPNIGFMQHIPSAKNYFDLVKHYLVPSNIIRHYIPEKYTEPAENVIASSLTLAAIGMTSYSNVLSLAFATHTIYNTTKSLLGKSSNSILATISLISGASYGNIASKLGEIAPRIIQGMNVLQIMSLLRNIDQIVSSIVQVEDIQERVEKDQKILIDKIHELIDDFKSFELTDSDKEEIAKIKITLQNTDILTEELRGIYEKLDKIESEYYVDASNGISKEFEEADPTRIANLNDVILAEDAQKGSNINLKPVASQQRPRIAPTCLGASTKPVQQEEPMDATNSANAEQVIQQMSSIPDLLVPVVRDFTYISNQPSSDLTILATT